MKVYVVTDDGKALTAFTGEIVENNLVEVGRRISHHKWSKVLPNWLDLMIPKTSAREREAMTTKPVGGVA